jgi:hypothetical protein
MSVTSSCLKVCVSLVTSSFLHTLFCVQIVHTVVHYSCSCSCCGHCDDCCLSLSCAFGSAVAPAVSHWSVLPEVWVRSQARFLWDLLSTKWHWKRFCSQCFYFPLSGSLNQCFVPTHLSLTLFTYTISNWQHCHTALKRTVPSPVVPVTLLLCVCVCVCL